MAASLPLLVGEVFVDVTIMPSGVENKLRLGGVVHAARGLWSLGRPFAVAAFLPEYLEQSARSYLAEFGCTRFMVLGHISGAPNVILIFDPIEVDDQKYEILLRDERRVRVSSDLSAADFTSFEDVLLFPGRYDIAAFSKLLPKNVRLHIDAAYDVDSIDALKIDRPITTVFLSTSSELFKRYGSSGIDELIATVADLQVEALVLKENRGGSRLHVYATRKTTEVPAQLGTTVNSVGVGDVFDATYLAYRPAGLEEAAWRATYASSAYAQSTDPDVFRTHIERESAVQFSVLRDLGGTSLPWEIRPRYQIYLAGPDFTYQDTSAIDRAVSSLNYHNFRVRRPVKENGELPTDSTTTLMSETYRQDSQLLQECSLVFAVPTSRDPGTLVEVGLAIGQGIPVIVYDPKCDCSNTMVIGGSECYSHNLDECLNATFVSLSNLRSKDP